MKPVVFTHTNPLLEDIKTLQAVAPETYEGFIYMWKCIPEDRLYIGSHKGVANDEYRGSGKTFRRVFEHYGLTQFERVVLEYVQDAESLRTREQYWMDKFKAVTSPRFYNEKNARR